MIASLLTSADNCFNRIGVRVPVFQHRQFEQCLALVCRSAAERLPYIALPKIANLAELQQAIATVNRCTDNAGHAQLPIQVLIETHGALADVFQIAQHPQVQALSFGLMDFVSAHYGAIPSEAMRSPGQFSHPLVRRAKLEIAAACHASGKVASHNVTTNIVDPGVVADDANRARREFGYTRMWSIHPNQILPILAAFTPSDDEVEQASDILRSAQANRWAPIQHQGTLHDRASYRYYWTVLQRAKASGLPLQNFAASLL